MPLRKAFAPSVNAHDSIVSAWNLKTFRI